jgi:hypothetical protein
MSPPRKNDNAPFFIQTRTFQRGLLKYAFEETGGDLEWASAILGVSEEFFRIQSLRLGGVFPGSTANEPPLEVAQVSAQVSTESQKVEEAPTPVEEPIEASSSSVQEVSSPSEEEPSIKDKAEEPKEEDIPLEASETVVAPIVPLVVSTVPLQDETADEAPAEGEEEEETRGRKPAVSPDPKFMTRREVELVLKLSTAGVLRLRSRGDLEAISSPELGGALLFPREKVEEFAKKRTELREKRKTD